MDAPHITKSMLLVKKDLSLKHLWIIYPGKETYKLDNDITVLPLSSVSSNWDYSY